MSKYLDYIEKPALHPILVSLPHRVSRIVWFEDNEQKLPDIILVMDGKFPLSHGIVLLDNGIFHLTDKLVSMSQVAYKTPPGLTVTPSLIYDHNIEKTIYVVRNRNLRINVSHMSILISKEKTPIGNL